MLRNYLFLYVVLDVLTGVSIALKQIKVVGLGFHHFLKVHVLECLRFQLQFQFRDLLLKVKLLVGRLDNQISVLDEERTVDLVLGRERLLCVGRTRV